MSVKKRFCVGVQRTDEVEHRAASLDAVLEMYAEEIGYGGVVWIIEEDDEVWTHHADGPDQKALQALKAAAQKVVSSAEFQGAVTPAIVALRDALAQVEAADG